MRTFLTYGLLLLISPLAMRADVTGVNPGRISGRIVDEAGRAAPGVAIAVQDQRTGRLIRSASSDERGAFTAGDLPEGDYLLSYGYSGDTAHASVTATRKTADVGRLTLSEDQTIMLQKMQVSAQREAFYNSIDRKTYDVGKDVSSTTGTASDLLQNIPSVQVDVEGEVSLRGDQNVTILINGKSSAQMGRNQAEALEQLSADRIERIEVITNPSAKYKPDGTGGIINIILKDTGKPGWAATARGTVGNDDRYNSSVFGSYSPGRFDVFGSLSYRHDHRPRLVQQDRLQRDSAGAPAGTSSQHTEEIRRYESTTFETGGTYKFNDRTQAGVSLTYGTRQRDRDSVQNTEAGDAAGSATQRYDRLRRGDEREKQFEAGLTFEHAFDDAGRKFNVELSHEDEHEKGGDYYTTLFQLPVRPDELERTTHDEVETDTELKADYAHPFDNGAQLETGYALLAEKSDVDFRGSDFDATAQQWATDALTTNRFIYESQVHALYATYGRPFGAFGVQAGFRFEQAYTEANQVTTGVTNEHDYGRLYPSVHLSYDLTSTQQLKMSYSHRVRRPDPRDLNPFPEYTDPLNLRAGNPDLEPEDIHSIEAGWQYRNDTATYLFSLYHRNRYNGITQITRELGDGVLLTTHENLATSRFTGLEIGATTRLKKVLSLNFSGNVYREEIQAQNLGFDEKRHALAWDAKLNASWEVSKKLSLQVTSGYRAKRMTPQGERRPMSVTNLGARYTLSAKTALVLTVSDLFETFEGRTILDTPTLHTDTTFSRSERIIYFGVIYQFGKSSKTPGGDLPLDDAMGGES